jgi:hypothetical protein
MEDRSTANPVNRDTVDQVSARLSGTNASSEKAKGVRFDTGVAKPSNVVADLAGRAHWQQCYGALWKLKLAFEKEHNR